MAITRGRPGGSPVRKSKVVGPDYAEGRFQAPWNAEIDSTFGAARDERDILSETAITFEGGGAESIDEGRYDQLWEGK